VIGLYLVKQIEKGGATRILLDKIIDKRNGAPALLVQGSDYYNYVNVTTFSVIFDYQLINFPGHFLMEFV
jgi:hypothetical protein